MGALKKVAGPPPKKPFKGAVELSWLERRLACTIGCLPTFRCLIYVILWCMFVVCMQIHFSNRNWIREPTKAYGDDKDEYADED
jgi:hypothetical protein